MRIFLDLESIQSLPWTTVDGFLRNRGWSSVSRWGEYAMLYRKFVGDVPNEVVLPTNSNLTDYAPRLIELMRRVSELEGISVDQIIRKLVSSAYDVVRVRALESDEFGTIPLAVGEALLESARELLASAASHEASHRPDRVRGGRVPDTAKEYIQRVRLGQTERGSFVMTLLSPYAYEPIEDHPELFDRPFGRRVGERLGRAFQAVEVALTQSTNRGIAAFDAGVEAGVSSKLCRALGEIALRSNGAELSVSWSAERPSDQSAGIRLDRTAGSILLDASEFLALKAAPETMYVEGTITGVLEGTRDLEGVVRILARIDGKTRVVQTRFSPEQRDVIFKAFQQKVLFSISMTGEVSRTTRPWTIEAPREFKLVTFDPL